MKLWTMQSIEFINEIKENELEKVYNYFDEVINIEFEDGE